MAKAARVADPRGRALKREISCAMWLASRNEGGLSAQGFDF